MSIASDVVKSLLLTKALPIAGLLLSVLVLIYGAYEWRLSAARHAGFTAGYGQARDSVDAVTIKRLTAVRDSAAKRAAIAAKAAQDGTTVLVPERARFDSVVAQRHTPRLEALTVPVTVDTSLVGVFVQNTGEHFVLPRRAAMYWATSDSLVGVAQRLIAKYAAANAGWANAYTAEHEARVGADSLASLWRARALANVAPPPRNMHRIAYLAVGVVAGFIAAKRIH